MACVARLGQNHLEANRDPETKTPSHEPDHRWPRKIPNKEKNDQRNDNKEEGAGTEQAIHGIAHIHISLRSGSKLAC